MIQTESRLEVAKQHGCKKSLCIKGVKAAPSIIMRALATSSGNRQGCCATAVSKSEIYNMWLCVPLAVRRKIAPW